MRWISERAMDAPQQGGSPVADASGLLERLLDTLYSLASKPFVDAGSRWYWLYFASAVAMAAVVYVRTTSAPLGVGGFARFLLPKQVWLHRSARADYVFVAITELVWAGTAMRLFVEEEQLGRWIAGGLDRAIGSVSPANGSTGILILYTVCLLLADDFRRFAVHRSFHRSSVLWEFHKVHHSAEVLTPITLHRVHPVEKLIEQLASLLALGVVTGGFLFLFPGGLTVVSILGVNAGRFVFDLAGAHLRHSHIWLPFGSALEHILISPAQHQIHHSCDPSHFDRNFGSQFAFWDWLFGSLYICRGQEQIQYGLGAEQNARLTSVGQLFVEPFFAIAARMRSDRPLRVRSAG
jgi:sterol desaturase/sphingolipid hydroxylase (fatty acid hydroxylase superfamily)